MQDVTMLVPKTQLHLQYFNSAQGIEVHGHTLTSEAVAKELTGFNSSNDEQHEEQAVKKLQLQAKEGRDTPSSTQS